MRPNPSPAGLTIGRLSARTGVHIETIRYYEKVGLLAKPERTTGGHRLYTPAHAQSLSFIRRGRELGLPSGPSAISWCSAAAAPAAKRPGR